MTTGWLVFARFVHFGSCLLLFGVFAFDRLVVASDRLGMPTEATGYWESRVRLLSLVALPVVLLSGLFWFAQVTMAMSGLPADQAFQPENLRMVWLQTQFGAIWRFRLVFWFVATVATVLLCAYRSHASLRRGLVWIALISSGIVLGGLAGAGHGQAGLPVRWHMCADVLHLLVAGFWPTTLLPLALLLRHLRRGTGASRWNSIAALIHRFSAISLAAVVASAITGWVNSWYLVGSLAKLVEQPYGRLLLLKVAIFCLAAGVGAVNLLRLKPRLAMARNQAKDAEPTAIQLEFNVALELSLGIAILVVVAILGTMPPAVG